MRRLVLGLLLGAMITTGSGCFLPIYSGDPARRARQLLFTSENLRLLLEDWERIWFLDHPDQMTPFRTSGGVI